MALPRTDTDPLSGLIACPSCDAVYRSAPVNTGERAVCARCHTVLMAPRRRAGKQLISMACTVLVLIVAASLFPFLTLRAGGFTQGASIFDTALAFDGMLSVLSLAVLCFIVFIPMARLVLLIYVLAPIVRDRPPARYAHGAFSFSEALRPWSMAEIFAIGCAVALVKLTDLADISFGPAFWMFTVVVVFVVATDNLMCRYSIWKSLQ